jgi:outer membrane protein insertion porin family
LLIIADYFVYMPLMTTNKISIPRYLKIVLVFSLIGSSCIIPRKYQKNKPFVTKNTIEVKGGNFTNDERISLKQRLNAQLGDSSKIRVVDKYFIRHIYTRPPAYDSASAGQSARNMRASMLHIGYYNSTAGYKADTVRRHGQQRVHVLYTVVTGKPTLIDTISYILYKPDLQQLAMQNLDKSLLKAGKPVTKAAIVGEMSRLVDLYHNNGYYKFTSEELKVRGDTTTAALTTISDDIFEQLRLLAEAQKAKDSPVIKLAVVLNPPSDSSRIRKFYIGNIYILPDYQPGDNLTDPTLTQRATRNYILLYHKKLFKTGFLTRNIYIRKGDMYTQDNFTKTINSLTQAGVWQSVNIQIVERKDSIDKIDLVVQLIPGKKYGFEASIETSYSANSNANNATVANAGNLLGVSGNVSILNRNFRKEGIKMTNAVRAGVELNLTADSSNNKNLINSNELTYSNSIIIPRFVWPFNKVDRRRFLSSETFFNSSLSYIKRFNLFDLQSFNFATGYEWTKQSRQPLKRPNRQWVWKPINFEFNRLYNRTAIFDSTLNANPFLKYSFNTALVAGLGLGSLGYKIVYTNPKFTNRQHSLNVNVEESGLILGRFNVLKNYLRQFVKTDVEYIYSVSHPKSAVVMRLFGGVGVPFKKDTTLPFFKQYFGGGSNSMRAWPVRGIGRGSQPLNPFGSTTFNDRTGDIQLEGNFEYRYDIAQIIPNSLTLKGALFIDAGNIWNFRNSKPGGGTDSSQFQFKNLYRELGIAAGTGFRLDFNYFVLRLDLGFRFKRPELSYINNGWKAPSLGFDDIFQKLFTRGQNDEYKKWRYENFNFTIGISYPF